MRIERLRERVNSGLFPDDVKTLKLLVDWGVYGRAMGLDDPWVREILMHLTPEEALEMARQKIIAEARPTILAEAKPTIIEEAKPTIIEEAKPTIIEEAKPAIVEASLRRLYERRLGRSLTPGEREVLLERCGRLGSERVVDVACDLEPEALVSWLALPDAS